MLAEHLRRFPAAPDGLIFTNEHGKPIRAAAGLGRWVQRAVAEVGAPADTTFHDLRHHYASLLIRHSASVKVVQSRLGHATAAETLNTYAHLWPDDEDRTRTAIDAAWRDLADYPRTNEGR